jgi:predicted double-glycine peptidase
MTADGLKEYLEKGTPVILLIQAWGDPATYDQNESGHYVIAIGYNEEELIVEDPALRLVRGFITWDELESRWHSYGDGDKIYDHWGMAISEPAGKAKAETNGHAGMLK